MSSLRPKTVTAAHCRGCTDRTESAAAECCSVWELCAAHPNVLPVWLLAREQKSLRQQPELLQWVLSASPEEASC